MRRFVWGISVGILLALGIQAAIPNGGAPVTVNPPSLKRVAEIRICNGYYEVRDNVAHATQPPSVSILVLGCETLKDGDGNALQNAYGLPVYDDRRKFQRTITITDPSELGQYFAIWNQLMTLAEARAQAADLRPARP